MKNNGKDAPERAEHPDPSATPTQAPVMETRPESARAQGLSLDVSSIGPDYSVVLISITDKYGIETRWMRPIGEKILPEDLERYQLRHIHASQAETRRN